MIGRAAVENPGIFTEGRKRGKGGRGREMP